MIPPARKKRRRSRGAQSTTRDDNPQLVSRLLRTGIEMGSKHTNFMEKQPTTTLGWRKLDIASKEGSVTSRCHRCHRTSAMPDK
jgi:hypothetical protein